MVSAGRKQCPGAFPPVSLTYRATLAVINALAYVSRRLFVALVSLVLAGNEIPEAIAPRRVAVTLFKSAIEEIMMASKPFETLGGAYRLGSLVGRRVVSHPLTARIADRKAEQP